MESAGFVLNHIIFNGANMMFIESERFFKNLLNLNCMFKISMESQMNQWNQIDFNRIH